MIKPEQIPKEVVEAIQICTGMSDSAARGLAIIMLEQWPQSEKLAIMRQWVLTSTPSAR